MESQRESDGQLCSAVEDSLGIRRRKSIDCRIRISRSGSFEAAPLLRATIEISSSNEIFSRFLR